MWSTHQFWVGYLRDLGLKPHNIVFSSDTSEEQFRDHGKGRVTVDCCYPVKAIAGHYGELLFGQKQKIDVLLSPMLYSLPSILQGHVADTLTCTRVMAGPENIKAGFMKERDLFADTGIVHAAPFVSLAEPDVVPMQMYESLKEPLQLTYEESQRATQAGFRALEAFNAKARQHSRQILEWCAREAKPCILVLGRPYHMDPGIGHEIEVELQAHGYPVLWMQYLPIDNDLMQWLFGEEIRQGRIKSPFDISDVWTSSYSSNTNEILWGAKIAARCPWITCVIRLSSYECGMDQPTYTPAQKIVEATGSLFFKFGDLDATKPSGSVRIRVETIVHYAGKYSDGIIQRKLSALPASPLRTGKPAVAKIDGVTPAKVEAATLEDKGPARHDGETLARHEKEPSTRLTGKAVSKAP